MVGFVASARALVFWGVMLVAGLCGLSLFMLLAVFAKSITVAASLQVGPARLRGLRPSRALAPMMLCAVGQPGRHPPGRVPARRPADARLHAPPTCRLTPQPSHGRPPIRTSLSSTPQQNLFILIATISSGFIVNQKQLSGGWRGACERWRCCRRVWMRLAPPRAVTLAA